MIRFTHRRCRNEAAALHDEADQLSDDLRAADHALAEVMEACRDLEYATTEAAIPNVLRDRLLQLREYELAAQDHVEVPTA
ncbi:hypothetical protein [Streptomyces sp. NPDC000931]|uniref:hypothetical protein n=1 Tax=Streptomyces sp. NPDC000931 TaxID=3154372 RepID=UPI00331AF5F9